MSGLLGVGRQKELRRAEADRIGWYSRYLRAYEGYSIRGTLGTNYARDWKRVKFNYNEPIVNLSAGFFAAKPLTWEVKGDPDATKAAHDVWDRSGSDSALLEAAIACCIYGDMVAIAADGKSGPVIEFVDPGIVLPTFNGADCARLEFAEIAYRRTDARGEEVGYREMWFPDHMEAYEDDTRVDQRSYDVLPISWIRNASVMGQPFGISDLHGIWDLVEEYDHIAGKQTRIIDYYAAPTIAFRGLTSAEFKKQTSTTVFLPTDGDMFFVEWKGNTPDVEAQLVRIRNAIAEKSQVPAVAFGQQDSGMSSISGVALQILYGPLIAKTHRKRASWGPSLERVMWLCLRAAGFKDLALTQVNVLWPDALPVDGEAQVNSLNVQVSGQIKSRRTAMSDLGIADPNEEMKRILVEEKLLGLGAPPAPAAPPAFAPDGSPIAVEQPKPADIGAILDEFDQIVSAEDDNAEALREQQDQAAGSQAEPAAE